MSHVNKSCHIWIVVSSVVSHINESCNIPCEQDVYTYIYIYIYIYIHVPCEWVMSPVLCHMNESCNTPCEWVVSHVNAGDHEVAKIRFSYEGVNTTVSVIWCYMVSTICVNSRWKQACWLTDFRHAESACIFQDSPYRKIGFPVYGVNHLCS